MAMLPSPVLHEPVRLAKRDSPNTSLKRLTARGVCRLVSAAFSNNEHDILAPYGA